MRRRNKFVMPIPTLDALLPDYPAPDSPEFYDSIYRKREFYDLRIPGVPDRYENFYSHQKIVARFLSNWTLYSSLLLIHDTGMGKSGSAAACFNGLKTNNPNLRTLYVTNSDTLIRTFKQQIFKLSPLLYDPSIMDKPVKEVISKRNAILRRAGFFFTTYHKLASDLRSSKSLMVKNWDRQLIIMDEVHHLVTKDSLKGLDNTPYMVITDFVRSLRFKKMLLMTATPMRDSPMEVSLLINMMKEAGQALPIGQDFMTTFFEPVPTEGCGLLKQLQWREGKMEMFMRFLVGLVSVVKTKTDLNVRYKGKIYPPMRSYALSAQEMHPEQMLGYMRAYDRDSQSDSLYSHSQQATLFVFPDGGSGKRVSGGEDIRSKILEKIKRADSKEEMLALMKQNSRRFTGTGKYREMVQISLVNAERTFHSAESTVKDMVNAFSEAYNPYLTPKGFTPRFIRETGMTPIMDKEREGNPDVLAHNLGILKKYSVTYGEIIQSIINNPKKLIYVYCDKVEGSGIKVCIRLLSQFFGYSQLTTTPASDKRKRCIFLMDPENSMLGGGGGGDGDKKTRRTKKVVVEGDEEEENTRPSIMRLIDEFNNPRNAEGDYVQVIFGTDKTREGITLMRLQQMHIASANWNFGKITQALGRGIRIGTHKDMPPNTKVNIYFHCAVPMHNKEWIEHTKPISLEEDAITSSPPSEADKEEEQQQQKRQQKQQRGQGQGGPPQRRSASTALVVYEGGDDGSGGGGGGGSGGEKFSPDQLQRSIDYHLYHLSEIKDRNIKNVEYALLISAFDCQLEKRQNDRTGRYQDDSPECMYRSCKYECVGITREEIPWEELDDSTFNLYYTQESLPVLSEILEKTFTSGKTLWTFADLVENIRKKKKTFNDRQVMDALLFCINRPYPFRTPDGRTLFLNKTESDVFYVSETRTQNPHKKEAWSSLYAPMPEFDIKTSFDSLLSFVKDNSVKRSCHRMRMCFGKNDVVEARKLLDNLSPLSLGIFLLQLLRIPEEEQNEFILWMRDHVAMRDPSLWVVNPETGAYLWRQSDTGKILQPDVTKSEWIPLTGELLDTVGQGAVATTTTTQTQDHQIQQFKQKYIRANPLKMYGYIEDGKFKIRDVSAYDQSKTKRQKPRGRVCRSLDAATIYKYFFQLRPALPNIEDLEGSPQSMLNIRNKIEQMSLQEVDLLFQSLDSHKIREFLRHIGKDKETMSEDEKRFVLYYNSLDNKTMLCELLERMFRKRQIWTKAPRLVAVTKPAKATAVKGAKKKVTTGEDPVFPGLKRAGGGGGGGGDAEEDEDDFL